MLSDQFIVLGCLVNFLAGIGYVIATVRGQARPNRVSWGLWSVTSWLAFLGQLDEGVGLPALLTLTVAAIPTLIFLASFVGGAYWQFSRLDVVCALLAIGTLIAWKLTASGIVAIVLSIAVDALAGIPTVVKAFREPESESHVAYTAGMFSAVCTLVTLTGFTIASSAFAIYFLTLCTTISFLLLVNPRLRERALRRSLSFPVDAPLPRRTTADQLRDPFADRIDDPIFGRPGWLRPAPAALTEPHQPPPVRSYRGIPHIDLDVRVRISQFAHGVSATVLPGGPSLAADGPFDTVVGTVDGVVDRVDLGPAGHPSRDPDRTARVALPLQRTTEQIISVPVPAPDGVVSTGRPPAAQHADPRYADLQHSGPQRTGPVLPPPRPTPGVRALRGGPPTPHPSAQHRAAPRPAVGGPTAHGSGTPAGLPRRVPAANVPPRVDSRPVARGTGPDRPGTGPTRTGSNGAAPTSTAPTSNGAAPNGTAPAGNGTAPTRTASADRGPTLPVRTAPMPVRPADPAPRGTERTDPASLGTERVVVPPPPRRPPPDHPSVRPGRPDPLPPTEGPRYDHSLFDPRYGRGYEPLPPRRFVPPTPPLSTATPAPRPARRYLSGVVGAVALLAALAALAYYTVDVRPVNLAGIPPWEQQSGAVAAPLPLAAPAAQPRAVATSIAVPTVRTTLAVGPTPGHLQLAPDGSFGLIAHRDAGFVSVFDTATDTITATIPVPAGPPWYMSFSPDGARAYLSIYDPARSVNAIAVLDLASRSVVATIPVGRRPMASAVTPDGSRLWVPSHDDGILDIIDTATDAVVGTVAVPPDPHWVAISDDGRRAYVADHESNVVTVLDTASTAVLATIPVGTSPHSAAVAIGHEQVAVVSFDASTVSLIDPATNAVVAEVPVGKDPQDVDFAPDGRYLYTANVDDDSVSVVDTTAHAVTATIPVCDAPTSVSAGPDGRQAFVTCLNSGEVVVLDTTAGR
jgi:YVTN family beta-propeller protein